jgi:group I intron endonuclease
MIGVYAITNKINGMSYIGQSTNIKRRWINHRCMNGKPGNALYNDIRKYGLENFTFEVLEICEKDKLIEMELHYIQEYDSVHNGHNVT